MEGSKKKVRIRQDNGCWGKIFASLPQKISLATKLQTPNSQFRFFQIMLSHYLTGIILGLSVSILDTNYKLCYNAIKYEMK